MLRRHCTLLRPREPVDARPLIVQHARLHGDRARLIEYSTRFGREQVYRQMVTVAGEGRLGRVVLLTMVRRRRMHVLDAIQHQGMFQRSGFFKTVSAAVVCRNRTISSDNPAPYVNPSGLDRKMTP